MLGQVRQQKLLIGGTPPPNFHLYMISICFTCKKPKYYYIRNDLPKASSSFNECADVCDQCQDIPQNVTSGSGTVLKFDQTEFFGNGLNQDIGLEEEGFLFVPDACADGSAGKVVF